MPKCVRLKILLATAFFVAAFQPFSVAKAQSAAASPNAQSVEKRSTDAISTPKQNPGPTAANATTAASEDEADDDDDTDEGDASAKVTPRAVVTLQLQDSGQLLVYYASYGNGSVLLTDFEMKAALESALSCQLKETHYPRHVGRVSNYVGSCASIPHTGLLSEGILRTAPIVALAQKANAKTMDLEIILPKGEIAESKPSASEQNDSATPQFATKGPAKGRFTMFNWKLDRSIPETVTFRSGYKNTVPYPGLWLLALLLAPLAIIYFLGQKALRADVPDKAVVWFSYMRVLSYILNFSLFIWWGAIDVLHLVPLLRLALRGTRLSPIFDHWVVTHWLGWIPPMAVWLLCYRMSHPVQEKLRGLNWTKKELTLQALYSLCAGLIPLAMLFTGINQLAISGSSAAMWFLAAFVVRVVAVGALLKLTGMQPRAVTSGPLRDHAFTMASRLGVKLQQVYLIPSGKGQMANAFASSAEHISFTDLLLERMSQPEIDFVLAHELTHLKLSHPKKLVLVRVISFFVAEALLIWSISLLPGASFAVVRYLLFFAFITTATYLFSRMFEYSADAGAVALTGNPRAAISALFKLSQLNMMPTQWTKWSEKWLSHPSSVRRAQAIALKAHIPLEEIPVIARDGASAQPIDSVAVIATPSDKLYSTQYKRASLQTLARILLAVICVVPCIAAVAALHLKSHRELAFAALAAAIPATIALFVAIVNQSPRLQKSDLRDQLKQKFRSKGVEVDKWGGLYVGLAPGVAPRTYESVGVWDIGFLFFSGDKMYYWGEEAQFMLRRDQITDIRLGPGLPGFLKSNRVYVAWRDDERGGCGVFNLTSRGASSNSADNQSTIALSSRLLAWREPTISSSAGLPAPMSTLSSPAFRAVTAAVPGIEFRSKKFYNELQITGWIAAMAALLFGLRFHLLPYVFAQSTPSGRIPIPYHSVGMGWYVVAAAVTIRFLLMIPGLRYKDNPVLVAQPVKPSNGVATTTVPSDSNSPAAKRVAQPDSVQV